MQDDARPGDRPGGESRRPWPGRGRERDRGSDHDHDHDHRDEHDHGGDGSEHRREPPLHESLGETDGRVGGDYVYERGRLLVDAAAVDAVRRELAERFGAKAEHDEPFDELGLVVLHLAPGAPDVPLLVDGLRELADPSLRAFPEHVLARASHPRFIPATTPRRADAREPQRVDDAPGDGLRIGVLDTGGVDHRWFEQRCDLRPGGEDDDASDPDGDQMLDHVAGHGTFIVGVVLQHLPRATVVARRILSRAQSVGEVPDQGWTTDTLLARTLVGCPELADVDVLNLSVGGYTHDGIGLAATDRALRRCRERNPALVVVAGAGNDATDTLFFPAAFKDVVAVGAVDSSGERACFSNFGWWVDACALGVDVHSTFLRWEGPLAPPPRLPDPCAGRLPEAVADGAFDGWALWDGTSFAAPRVAAAVAARIREVGPAQAVADVVRGPGLPRVDGLGVFVDPPGF